MPRLEGLETAQIRRKQTGHCPIVIFVTLHDEPGLAMEAIAESGAAGQALKRRAPFDARTAIEEALAGYTLVSPPFADKLSH